MVQTKNRAFELSFNFAVEIIKYCYNFQKEHKEYIITRQLIKSGSSIGANLEEAVGGNQKGIFLQSFRSHTKKLEKLRIG